MKIIIGLGNPGKKYENTWHNIGFLAVDEYIKENNFPELSFDKKFSSEISEKIISDEKIIIAKPQTYMNESGKAVKAIMNFYKAGASDFIIVHDDIDLPLPRIKISFDRGSAGHKGIQSVFNQTGKEDFIRIRIGIGSDGKKERQAIDAVLEKISSSKAKKSIKSAAEAIETIIAEGAEKAMNRYNQ